MEKGAGQDEVADEEPEKAAPSAPVPRKRKRKRAAIVDGGASGAMICDDVISNILARLPARTAIACTALSKHHRHLIRSAEFRSLHCRLAAPLPRPHIAYVATTPIKRRPEQKNPASMFHGFHVAGAGLSGSSPMRALTGWTHLGTNYVGTCNGVVVLASDEFSAPCRCTLWNPAVADVPREVSVPEPSPVSECLVLGLGYCQRSKTYKLLLCRKDSHPINTISPCGLFRRIGGPTHRIEYSLIVLSLGGVEMQTPLRTVLSEGVDEEIKQKSLYMDGTIYLLHLEKSAILAFDVDDETVSRIGIPGERQQDQLLHGNFELIEMSGRPCMVRIDNHWIDGRHCLALWLLTADRHWERACVISDKDFSRRSIIGAWDCGGVLALYLEASSCDEVWLHDVTTKKIFKAQLPGDLMTIERSEYKISWGYRPTLVSPGSIAGEIDLDLERRRNRSARIAEVINPLGLQDRRKGQEATLSTVCLMEFLVRIMQKLPDDMQDVVEMPTMDYSDDPDFLFDNVVDSD